MRSIRINPSVDNDVAKGRAFACEQRGAGSTPVIAVV